MSKVILKDVEILKLKEKNNQNNKEIKIVQEKITKQKLNLTRQTQLQGSKHIIWDLISTEISKFWDYFSLMDDKTALVTIAQVFFFCRFKMH